MIQFSLLEDVCGPSSFLPDLRPGVSHTLTVFHLNNSRVSPRLEDEYFNFLVCTPGIQKMDLEVTQQQGESEVDTYSSASAHSGSESDSDDQGQTLSMSSGALPPK